MSKLETIKSYLPRPIWLVLLLTGWFLFAQAVADPIVDKANEMAQAYNQWGKMRSARQQGTFNAQEFRVWQEVKSRWKELEKVVDKEYAQ